MRLSQPILLLASLLLLSACGDREAAADAAPASEDQPARTQADPAPADTPDEAAEPPLPSGDFRIVSVTLGSEVDEEGQVTEAKEEFASGEKIHASVISLGSSEGLTLSAHWTSADGGTVATAGQSLSPATPTVTLFSISQPDPWPAGDYRVDVSINGRVTESRRFSIR